jgi:hypothetical protein
MPIKAQQPYIKRDRIVAKQILIKFKKWKFRVLQQVRSTLIGAAAPAPCHVFGPNQVLPRVHNLDEQD